jgi:hypothetical protein
MESNDAARAMFDTLLENCIFYISPMYEFLHSQGHNRTFGDVGSMSALPPQQKENRDRRGWWVNPKPCGALTVDQADRRQGTSIDTRPL